MQEDASNFNAAIQVMYLYSWHEVKHIYGPRQANLCLRAFRHDKFQLHMPSHSEGPGIWLSVWRFLMIHCLYERAAKVLARLRVCAGSPKPSLLAKGISTKFAWHGPYPTSLTITVAKHYPYGYRYNFTFNDMHIVVCSHTTKTVQT